MKTIIFSSVLFLIMFITSLNAQSLNLSADVTYPVPAGDNFIHNYYNGIADLGLSYRPFNLSPVSLGVSANLGFLSGDVFGNDVSVTLFKGRISAEANLGRFTPFAGVGYALFTFNSDVKVDDNTRDGININAGLKYNIWHKIYLTAGYDFIRLKDEGLIDNTPYNLSLHFINFGAGITF